MNNLSKKVKLIGAITISLVLILGLILGIVLKFNTNFELGGYSEFVVKIDSSKKSDIDKAVDGIKSVLEANDIKVDTIMTSRNGDGTEFVTRYFDKTSRLTTLMINAEIKEKLNLDSDDFTHNYYEGVAKKAVLYTTIALLIIVAVFSVFATIRYARFTGLVTLISNLLGTSLYLSITTILRLTVGMSYFALLIILNLFIMYYEICLFEGIDHTSNDRAEYVNQALIRNKKNLSLTAIVIAVVGLLFVVVSPTSLKFISLDLLFIPVVCLVIGFYVAPYFYTLFANIASKRKNSIKSK